MTTAYRLESTSSDSNKEQSESEEELVSEKGD